MRLVFHLIPHTHWDREWYLTEPVLRVRLVAMIEDLLVRIESGAVPSFTMDGQAILLTDFLAVRPEREPVLAAMVKSGRLEVGPWYTLADEQMVSGESLIRNLLEGRRIAERLGKVSGMLYAPDSFGHPAVLPDLAREFGLERGVTWRGWRGARDAFEWLGPGGGKLHMYHLPPQGYEVGAALPADPSRLPEAWAAVRGVLVARASSPHIAVFVGADHHFVHRDLGLLRQMLAALEPGNDVRISRVDEFLSAHARLAQGVVQADSELRDSYGYTWTLQGTLSTRAPLKRRNSELEVMLERIAAPLAALAGGAESRSTLAWCWRRLLENHFHDSIAGTVADAVADTMRQRFADVEGAGEELARRSTQRILQHQSDRARENPGVVRPALALWNPAARRRGGVVTARMTVFRKDVIVGPPGDRVPRTGDVPLPRALGAPTGELVSLQHLGSAITHERLDADHHYPDQDEVEAAVVALAAPELPGLGWMVMHPVHGGELAAGHPIARGDTLDNGIIRVTVNRQGRLDLTCGAVTFPGLGALAGCPDRGDTYTFDAGGNEAPLSITGPVTTRVVSGGPLVGAVEMRWSVKAGRSPWRPREPGSIHCRLLLQLFQGSPVLRAMLELDNQAVNHRVRMRLPLGMRDAGCVTGTQLGALERAVTAPQQAEPMEARAATVPAHRFAAAAMGERGLAFMAPGFFETEWTGSDLFITLLRSVGELSRGDLASRPGHAGWPVATPEAQCLGRTRIAFALVPVTSNDLVRGDVLPAHWEDAFVPLQATWFRDATTLTPPAASLELEGEGIVLSTIKPAEESAGYVVRLYNATSRMASGTLRFGTNPASVMRIRADERDPKPLVLTGGGRQLDLRMPPRSWITLLVG